MKASLILALLLATVGGGVAGFFVARSSNAAAKDDGTTTLVSDDDDSRIASRAGTSKPNSPDGQSVAASAFSAEGDELLSRIQNGEAVSIKEIMKLPGQTARIEALLALAKTLDADGVEATLNEARQMERGMDQMISLNLLLSRYGEMDPQKALAFVGEVGGMMRGFGSGSILRSWAATDPQAASKYFSEQLDADGGEGDWMAQRSAASIAGEWAKQDPSAALEWAQTLPEGVRNESVEQVLSAMTASDPIAATEFVMGLDAGDERTRYVRDIAEQWGRMDAQDALDWANTLSGEERTEAVGEVVESWARNSPAEAAAYVDQVAADERAGLLRDVADAWSWTDASAAAEWVAGQPESEGRASAVGELVQNWMRQDAIAASTWLGQMSAGDSRDAGIVSLVSSREMRSDPDSATHWAAEITNAETRTQQVTQQATRWLREDRAAATEWIVSADLPQEQQDSLLSLTDEQLQSSGRGGDFRFRPF